VSSKGLTTRPPYRQKTNSTALRCFTTLSGGGRGGKEGGGGEAVKFTVSKSKRERSEALFKDEREKNEKVPGKEYGRKSEGASSR